MDNAFGMDEEMFPPAVEMTDFHECDFCGEDHLTESCLQLNITTIVEDNKVPPKAILTLPQNLRIKYPIIKDQQNNSVPKITAKEKINRGTRFGPLQAPLTLNVPQSIQLIYKVIEKDGKFTYFDTSCPDQCNWMSLVLAATSKEQHNLIAYQIGQSIYFNTLRDIRVHEELRVWYAPFFAKKLGVASSLPSTGEEIKHRKCKSKAVTRAVVSVTELQTETQKEIASNNTYQLRVRNKLKRKIYEDFVDINDEDKESLEKKSKDDDWICSQCGDVFDRQRNFAKHLLEHFKQPSSDMPIENHNCQFCQINFSNANSLQQHYIDQHKENFAVEQGSIQALDENISDADAATILLEIEANCDKNDDQQISPAHILDDSTTIGEISAINLQTCEDTYVDSNKVVEKSAGSSSNSCEICRKKFLDQHELLSHIRQHVEESEEKVDDYDERRHSCVFCQKTFSNKLSLKVHQDRHTGTFSCFECGCSFTSKEMLAEHECSSSKNSGDNFSCQICQKSFAKLKYLEKHIPVHTGTNACHICGKWLRSSESLVNHLRICGQSIKDLDEGGYAVCPLCKETFLNLKDFRQHMFQHRRAFVCSRCGARFRNNLTLENHICSEIANLECDICNSKFDDVSSFNQHLASVHEGTLLKCNQCNATFNSKELLESHQCTPRKKYRNNKSLDPLICSTCGALFSSTSSLKIHMRLHEDKLFSCEVCGKRFHRKDLMLDHWSVHGEPTIPCTICNKKFKTKKSLDVHIATHDGLKRFSCETCGKKFFQKGNLIKHSDIHNPSRKYSCEYCPKTFTTKEYLAIHVMEHTKGKQFLCDICNKGFIKEHQLKSHQRIFHANVAFTCSFCGLNVKFKHSLKRHLQKKHMDKKDLWSKLEQIDQMMVPVDHDKEASVEDVAKAENEEDEKTEVVLAVSGIGSEALQQALVSGAAKIKQGSTPNTIEITLPSQDTEDMSEEICDMQNESQLATTHIIQLPFTDENENEQSTEVEEALAQVEDESKQQYEIIVTSDIGTQITLDNEDHQILATGGEVVLVDGTILKRGTIDDNKEFFYVLNTSESNMDSSFQT